MLRRDEFGNLVITEAGHELLQHSVTDTRGPVYVLKENLPSSVAAAAITRLSHCTNELRVILLNEFLPKLPTSSPQVESGKERKFLKQVISDYGDDSVQQLVSLYVVVEAPSNIMTKVLERPRLMACIEQSSRYNILDGMISNSTDEQHHYRYHIPEELTENGRRVYVEKMDQMFRNYSRVVRQLHEYLLKNSNEPEENRDAAWKSAIRSQACDAARDLLPAATTTTVGLFASTQCLDSLIMHMRGHELCEVRRTGDAILREVRKVVPVFFERTDMPGRGADTTAYLKETKEQIKTNFKGPGFVEYKQEFPVMLCDYWPLHEDAIISELAYAAGATIPDPRILSNKDFLRYVLTTYVGDRTNRRHKPGRLFEKVHYTFRVRGSYAIFRALQRHRLVDAFEWLTLKYAEDYDVPELVKKAGLEMFYRACFVHSESLSEGLLHFNGETVAQYAILLGNKINWTWTVNLRELMHIIELRTAPNGHPEYRKLCQLLYEQMEIVHPMLAETLKFVNLDDDHELTRLESERAAALRLKNLQ